jgi:hypothetical protein
MADLQKPSAQPVPEINTKNNGEYIFEEVEHAAMSPRNDNLDEEAVEPEFHARTWIALAAFFLLNYTQVVALQGPSAVVSTKKSIKKALRFFKSTTIDIISLTTLEQTSTTPKVKAG